MTPGDLEEMIEQSEARGVLESAAFMQHVEACQLPTKDCPTCWRRYFEEMGMSLPRLPPTKRAKTLRWCLNARLKILRRLWDWGLIGPNHWVYTWKHEPDNPKWLPWWIRFVLWYRWPWANSGLRERRAANQVVRDLREKQKGK